MILSEIGRIAEEEWQKTPNVRKDMNLLLEEFIVMPNHFHGIIVIGANAFNQKDSKDAMHRVFTEAKNSFGPQAKNLASIIRGFKSSVTMKARKINPQFAWQENYHDRIIRDYEEYERIADYIINNPLNWESDRFSK